MEFRLYSHLPFANTVSLFVKFNGRPEVRSMGIYIGSISSK